MYFMIKSVNNKGNTAIALSEADNYKHIVKKLNDEKVIVLSITPLPNFINPFVIKSGKKISAMEVVELMENMNLVIKTGLPLHQGLLDLAEESDSKRYKEMLLYVADAVNSGKSLSVAFEKYENIVGSIIINLIKIGEETGQLEATLLRAAIFLKKTIALKKKAKGALIYPTFAFVAVMGAMLVWMIYVLPQMTSLFKQMDMVLPPLTLAIIAMSHFLTNYIGYMLISLVLFVVGYKLAYKKNQKFRYFIDKMVLKIPIIKEIASGFNIAFIAEYLRLALVSGVPVHSALNSLAENITNEPFKEALENTRDAVSRGSQISSAFSKTKLFTSFTIRMISVGESSGNLDSQLELISDHYYEQVDYFAENIGKVIEPVVLIFVGGFMALVIAGLMGPMYDLLGNMK